MAGVLNFTLREDNDGTARKKNGITQKMGRMKNVWGHHGPTKKELG